MNSTDSTKPCEWCGTAFEVKYPRNPNRFCCYACRNASYRGPQPERRKRQAVICATCGETVWVWPSHAKRQRYCSRACNPHFRDRRVEVECELCGKVVLKQPSVAGRFCSDSCRVSWFALSFRGEDSPHWRGGQIGYYGPDWKEQRRRARERDGHLCRVCGIDAASLGQQLSVHHLVPFRVFGVSHHKAANALGNLVSLCPRCHRKAENGIRDDNRPDNLELRVSIHPKGQRVTDLVAFAKEILKMYGDETMDLGT